MVSSQKRRSRVNKMMTTWASVHAALCKLRVGGSVLVCTHAGVCLSVRVEAAKGLSVTRQAASTTTPVLTTPLVLCRALALACLRPPLAWSSDDTLAWNSVWGHLCDTQSSDTRAWLVKP